MKFGTKDKGRIPTTLIDYLLSPFQIQLEEGEWIRVASRGQRNRDPEETVREEVAIHIPERMLRKSNKYPLNRVMTCKGVMQLILEMEVELTNGSRKLIKVLVDTGAEANLVKRGVIPSDLTYPARKVLQLVAANGQPIQGGGRTASMKLGFTQEVDGRLLGEELDFDVQFWEADIEVDAILSYPWMCQNRIGIFPHHRALARDRPVFTLLYGRGSKRVRAIMKEQGEETCREIGAADAKPPRLISRRKGVFLRKRNLRVGQPRRVCAQVLLGGEHRSMEERRLRLELESMDLRVPAAGNFEKPERLNKVELGIIAEKLGKGKVARVNELIEARGEAEEEDPRVAGWKNELLEEFGKTVLSGEIVPNPPVRGPYGYAYIQLKEGAVPQREKPFRMHGERERAHLQVTEDWIAKAYLERPFSFKQEWLHQSFVVPKKSATFPWRGIGDMRGVNSQSRRVNYPLPRIEDLLVKQGSKLIFSIIDLKQAFHQQPLHPDSRHLTCIYTPLGIYQWKVNVMGLMNASQQFQQMMDDRLSGVSDVATPFIDDIIIGTWVPQGEDLLARHREDVHRVLKVLEADQFVADPAKCKFFVREVEFCGHILGRGTRKPSPGKLRVIEKWEVPKTISELRAFLGFTNYYSSYIHMYGDIVARLQEKLKVPRELGKKGSKHKVIFTDEEREAFDEIKHRLCSELLLQHVDPDKPFVLRTDASRYAVGATLEQLIGEDRHPTEQDVIDKKTVPVAFMSRKLAKGQRNWTPREQETYAIVLALQKWESWIGNQPVLVLTDHKALESWAKEVLDTPSGPLGRRSRWHQIFSRFDLSVGYIPGSQNLIPDILSRWAYPASQAFRDISKHGTEEDDAEMRDIIREEREEERQCMWIKLKGQPNPRSEWIRGIKEGERSQCDSTLDKCTGPEGGMGEGVRGTETRNAPLSSPSKRKIVRFALPKNHVLHGDEGQWGTETPEPPVNVQAKEHLPHDEFAVGDDSQRAQNAVGDSSEGKEGLRDGEGTGDEESESSEEIEELVPDSSGQGNPPWHFSRQNKSIPRTCGGQTGPVFIHNAPFSKRFGVRQGRRGKHGPRAIGFWGIVCLQKIGYVYQQCYRRWLCMSIMRFWGT